MTASPYLTWVQYQSAASAGGTDSLTLMWNTGGGTTFTVRITNVTTAATQSYSNLTGFTTTVSPGLNATSSYTAAIACTDGGTTGTYSAEVPVVTATPALTCLAYLQSDVAASLDIQWQAAGTTGTTYAVTLQLGNTSQTLTGMTDTSLTYALSQPLSGTGNSVGVQVNETVTNNGKKTAIYGPSSSATVITATTSLTQVDGSDGTSLTLAWAAASGAAAYLAALAGSDGSSQTQAATGTQAGITGPFTSGVTYTATVSVTSADGVSIGPASTARTAITEAPTLTAVENSGADVSLNWSLLSGCSWYKAAMTAPDGTQTLAYGYGPSLTFSGSPDGTGYTCSVAGTSTDGVVLGPACAPVTIIVGSPLWVLVAYDSDIMDLSWTTVGDPTVSGYQIVVDGLEPTSVFNADGTSTSTSITATLEPLTSYPTTVRAMDGVSLGPSSPALIPLTTAPQSAYLGYTGTALQLGWQPSGESGVTGYTVNLLANGTSVESGEDVLVSPETFTTVFAAATAYTGQVRSSGAGTLGPWANAAGPYKSTRTYQFDPLGRIQSIAWAGAFTETYAFDTAGNLTSASYVASSSNAQGD